MKVLFFVPYPTKGPSNRFRVEQYFPVLREHQIDYKLDAFQTDELYDILYSKDNFFRKFALLIYCSIRRFFCLFKVKKFDVIFIHREAFPIFGSLFSKIIYLLNKNIVYDFDDSLFLYKSNNVLLKFLKQPKKLSEIIKLSKVVIAGNTYLRDYALKFNRNIIVIHTPIDTEKFVPKYNKPSKNKIVIGWVGSRTTSKYLNKLTKVFNILISKCPNLEVQIIGGNCNFGDPRIINKSWSLEKEIENLQNFDIGLMPMDNDEWAKGKCAFKIIQYMSIGIPVVASPVGMNLEVIKEGINGFFASSERNRPHQVEPVVA